jgi:hypothetical protein
MAQSPTTVSKDPVEAELRETALDYIEAWYDGNPQRMEQSIHPDLAKRIVAPNPDGRGDRLDQMSGMTLLWTTRHDPIPARERRAEVTILDRFENIASARLDATTWIDYLHLVRWNGRWVIVNVLSAQRTGTLGDTDHAALLRAARHYPHECSLHPELAKRTIGRVQLPSPEWPSPSWPPGDKLYHLSALSLLHGFARKALGPAPPEKQPDPREPRLILDRFENVASVRSDGPDNVDYLHLAKWNGQWLIVNVLWELKPEAAAKATARDAARRPIADGRAGT